MRIGVTRVTGGVRQPEAERCGELSRWPAGVIEQVLVGTPREEPVAASVVCEAGAPMRPGITDISVES